MSRKMSLNKRNKDFLEKLNFSSQGQGIYNMSLGNLYVIDFNIENQTFYYRRNDIKSLSIIYETLVL